MFKAIQIQLACQACIEAEKAHECQHMNHLIPRWQDSDKHRRLKTIMSDRPDLINSELGGIAVGNNDQCFKVPDLKRMFENSIFIQIPLSASFFCTIDPCAGGEHSDFALVSFIICNGAFHVLGAEALQTKDPFKTFGLLDAHIKAVRATYSDLVFAQCKVIVERNLGFEAEHLYRECRKFDNLVFMKERNSDRIGVLTTQNIKLGFTTYTNILLRENRVFCVKSGFIDLSKSGSRDTLFDQLSFFSFTFSAPATVLQKERFAISGKANGGKDDLAMAFLIGLYFSADPRFVCIS
tara:strand:+ start:1535 stop:2419 length:885 start_codon:yes stop_codon:yes gene_type:complete